MPERTTFADMQSLVREFHRASGMTVGAEPMIRDHELRIHLIEEEAAEVIAALRSDNLVGVVDGLCDLMYVAFGTAVAIGVELEPFLLEVHRSNMAKVGGPKRLDGKQLKPAGWQPPELQSILDEQTRASRAEP